jgi:WD40 repeat protein
MENPGYSIIKMLYKTNIFAFVGLKDSKTFSDQQLMIWDDLTKKSLSDLTFINPILNLEMRLDYFFVITAYRIYIFDSKTFEHSLSLTTDYNPHGLFGVSMMQDIKPICVFPSENGNGKVRVQTLDKENLNNNAKLFEVKCHESKLAFIAVSFDGKIFATASENGQKIRIFSTDKEREYLQELHRGQSKANINILCIDEKNKYLSAISDKCTIHIWSIKQARDKLVELKLYKETEEEKEENNIENQKSFFSFFIKNEWSFGQLRLKEESQIFTFGPNNNIFVVTKGGKLYKAPIKKDKIESSFEENLF